MQNKNILLGLITSLILRAQFAEVSERVGNPQVERQHWQCDGIKGHDISRFGLRWCWDVLPEGEDWRDRDGYNFWRQLGPRKYFCNDGVVNYESEQCCFNRYSPYFPEPSPFVFSMSRDQNYREKTCVHGTCQAPGRLDDCKCPPGYHSTDENQQFW